MPDFLSNLVHRALGQAPILQRRRRFLFEPPFENGGLDSPIQIPSFQRLEESIDLGETPPVPEIPSADQKARPRSRARRPPPVPSPSSADIAEPSLDYIAGSNSRQNITASRRAWPAVPSTAFQEEATERTATPANHVRRHPTRVEEIETIIEREVRTSETTTRNASRAESLDRPRPFIETFSPRGPSKPLPSIRQSPTREVEDRREIIRPPEKEIPNLRDRPRRPIPVKSIAPALKPVTASVPRAAPSTPRATIPEIRVTIGRLEIHAATPSSLRAVPAKSAGPRLSLEAYLRSRSGGAKE